MIDFSLDVIGRRPVIFIGIIGVSMATLLFGLQRTLTGILLVRSIGQSVRLSIDRACLTHHRRWFLLGQRSRHLLGVGRNYRLDEPCHRVTHLRACLANRFYHRVSISTDRFNPLDHPAR